MRKNGNAGYGAIFKANTDVKVGDRRLVHLPR